MNVVLVYNPASGGNFRLRQLKKLLADSGLTVTDSFSVTQLQSLKLARLVKKGVTLAVVGGDGTLNAAAGLVAGTKSTLLPLPGGTFNHFVRDLGMAGELDNVLKNIQQRRTMKVDVAYVNEQLFLNNSNIGMYPMSLLERDEAKRFMGKWLAAAWSSLSQLIEFRRHRLTIDGQRVKSPFMFVGNNAYDIETPGMPTRDGMQAGTLFVVISKTSSRLKLMRLAFLTVLGKVEYDEAIEIRQVKELEVNSPKKELLVSYDGEAARMKLPLRYISKPGQLRVMYVPKSDV